LAIELLDRRFGLRPLGVFHERKTTRSAGFAVERADNLRWFADLRKVLAQIFFRGLIREITYEQSNWWHGTRGGGGVIRSCSMLSAMPRTCSVRG
jgi:hypothetical protein